MRKGFECFIPLSKDEKIKLWDKATFVFDTSVLLALYQMSEKTRNQTMKMIHSVSDRAWIPFQVAQEFHRNRSDTILTQSKMYDSLEKQLNDCCRTLTSDNAHPFVDEAAAGRFTEIVAELIEQLTERRNRFFESITADPILDELSGCFDGRIEDQPDQEKLAAIYRDGAARFEAKTPPGFRDAAKPEPDRYGDLVIWKSIIAKASEDSVPVVFVTNDQKDDWWEKVGDRTIGPLPELREEISRDAGQDAHFYTLDRFVKHAAEKRDEPVSEFVRDELEYIRDKKRQIRSQQIRDAADVLGEADQLTHVLDASTANSAFAFLNAQLETGAAYAEAARNAQRVQPPFPGRSGGVLAEFIRAHEALRKSSPQPDRSALEVGGRSKDGDDD